MYLPLRERTSRRIAERVTAAFRDILRRSETSQSQSGSSLALKNKVNRARMFFIADPYMHAHPGRRVGRCAPCSLVSQHGNEVSRFTNHHCPPVYGRQMQYSNIYMQTCKFTEQPLSSISKHFDGETCLGART